MSDLSRRSFVRQMIPFALGSTLTAGWAASPRQPGATGRDLEALLSIQEGTFYEPEFPVSEKPEVPHEFTGVEGEYADFIANLNLRHIKPHELILPHRRTRRGVSNSLPPRSLWKNMPPTLHAADEIRDRLGVPLRAITSAYRSPAYNSMCPGSARRSQHLQNTALDLIFDTSPRSVSVVAKQLQKEGFFKGGVGVYSGFVHLDTRGQNATW